MTVSVLPAGSTKHSTMCPATDSQATLASAAASVPARLLEYLQILRADRIPHSGRCLLDHLAGTHRLLQSWHCQPPVCSAGLFHSIYGTNAFGLRRLDLQDRSLVVRMIGPQAEQLVYLFCVSRRPDAFLDAFDTGVLRHRDSDEPIVVPPTTLTGLIEIECANLIEQGGGQRFLRHLVQWAQARSGAGLRARMLAVAMAVSSGAGTGSSQAGSCEAGLSEAGAHQAGADEAGARGGAVGGDS